jgi:hypothetical protein
MGISLERDDELLGCWQSRCCEARAASDGVVSSFLASARPLAAHSALRPNHLSPSLTNAQQRLCGRTPLSPNHSSQKSQFRAFSLLVNVWASFIRRSSSSTRVSCARDFPRVTYRYSCALRTQASSGCIRSCSCQPERLLTSCRSLRSTPATVLWSTANHCHLCRHHAQPRSKVHANSGCISVT